MKTLKAELATLSALLEGGADTPEELAEAFVKELDRLRGERAFYYACYVSAGIPGAVGPFSTKGQAERAITKAGIAEKVWIVGGHTEEGFAFHLANVDKKPEPRKLSAKEQAAQDKGFWQKKRRIDDKEIPAITNVQSVTITKLGMLGDFA